MKLTTIIGTAIAAVGLTACGSSVAPTSSPTLALSVAPTVAPTPIPTLSPSESPLPSASASPIPTEGPCGYQPCGTGVGSTITCAVPGTAQGGSLIITWTAGVGQAAPVVPDTITVDGGTPIDVTSNPFTSGPYSIGNHSWADATDEWASPDGSFPFTISACVPTPQLTVTANCAPGRVAWTGTETGDTLFIGAGTFAVTLPTQTSGTYGPLAAGTYDTEFIDTSDDLIGGVTTITIGVCPKPTPKPSASSVPGTGARLG
jgi:hypothetical protein